MADAQTSTNVIPLFSAKKLPPAASPFHHTIPQSAELAVLVAILDGLHTGSRSQRKLFERIYARVRVKASERPDDLALANAKSLVATSAWGLRNGR